MTPSDFREESIEETSANLIAVILAVIIGLFGLFSLSVLLHKWTPWQQVIQLFS